MSHPAWPDPARILAGLKDFQRQTVEYVFRRLYTDAQPTRRFLVADEVGLGKTLVARGLIARVVDHLHRRGAGRIDIIYVCANRDIARQNINKLNITGAQDLAMATRLTLLPVRLRNLEQNPVNFISLTPGTSFNLRSQGGIAEERALLYHMLRRIWHLGEGGGADRLLQNEVGRESWKRRLKTFPAESIDPDLERRFAAALAGRPGLRAQYEALADRFARLRGKPGGELRQQGVALIGELRRLLARVCVRALQPDLVILDEFQRFKTLLDGEDEVAELAQDLLGDPEARVLLLSATPYKMYTLYQEPAGEDHYTDFLRTVRFLLDSEAQTAAFEGALGRYRQELYRAGPGGSPALAEARAEVETTLRRVMVRTERLEVTAQRDGLLELRPDLGGLAPADLHAFAVVDRVAQHLEAGDVVEYWKSAPYLLNLMDRDHYRLKAEFVAAARQRTASAELAPLLAGSDGALLQWEAVQAYRRIDPGNARLRRLLARTVERGAWRLLWLPPSLPYYVPATGPYVDPDLRDFTKVLVFSSWHVVPKAIAMLCSYEAERALAAAYDGKSRYTDERNQPLRFTVERGRPGAMSALLLLYPCWTLATRVDPMHLAASLARGDALPDAAAVAAAAAERIRQLLAPILREHDRAGDRPPDERWYWAALALLDARYGQAAAAGWLHTADPKLAWQRMLQDEQSGGFARHVELFRSYFRGAGELGQPPDDLVEVLTQVALGSPAVTALRALLRVASPEEARSSPAPVLAAAARIAAGFRTLFNAADAVPLVRGLRPVHEAAYWQAALAYCINGNLQAVLDEYMHVLQEWLGLTDQPLAKLADSLAETVREALTIRRVNLDFDEIQAGRRLELVTRSLRCHFALRYGDGRSDEGEAGTRADQVRTAFNSPFRPFVLASTAIGQEGLDFHLYCHEIFHWNLPANPMDLEQREGRIHRYKGHVIRRNLGRAYPLPALAGQVRELADPWEAAFRLARAALAQRYNELVPYWIFEVPDGYKVLCHLPALPLSREAEQLAGLRRTRVAYRMVFGQPRQEDLVAYLQERLQRDLDPAELARYRIQLAPPQQG